MARTLKTTGKVNSESNLTLRKVNRLFESKIDASSSSKADMALLEKNVKAAVLKCVREAHDSVTRETSFGGGKNKGEFKVAGSDYVVLWVSNEHRAPGSITFILRERNYNIADRSSQDSKIRPDEIYNYFIRSLRSYITKGGYDNA